MTISRPPTRRFRGLRDVISVTWDSRRIGLVGHIRRQDDTALSEVTLNAVSFEIASIKRHLITMAGRQTMGKCFYLRPGTYADHISTHTPYTRSPTLRSTTRTLSRTDKGVCDGFEYDREPAKQVD
jgi:hypothetical protein